MLPAGHTRSGGGTLGVCSGRGRESLSPSGGAHAQEVLDVTTTALPIPRWTGEMLRAGQWRLFVRHAPARAEHPEPAVMVHGLGGQATNWTDLMHLLGEEMESWAVDLPGFGQSPPPDSGDYRPAAKARAVVAFVEQLGRGPVHLFGNSLGGAVATLVASARPDLVRTLTLVSPALPHLKPRLSNAHLGVLAVPFLGERVATAMGAQSGPEGQARRVIDLCFADPAVVPLERRREAEADAAARARLPYSQDVMLASLRQLLVTYAGGPRSSVWRAAAGVHVPTLLVYGRQDKLVDWHVGARAARIFPQARLLVLDRCGHVAQMERPREVAAAVRDLAADARCIP